MLTVSQLTFLLQIFSQVHFGMKDYTRNVRLVLVAASINELSRINTSLTNTQISFPVRVSKADDLCTVWKLSGLGRVPGPGAGLRN